MIEWAICFIQSFKIHSFSHFYLSPSSSNPNPMRKKILLNVFFNLGIIVSIIGMSWAYNNKSPLIVAFFAATMVAFVYVKIQLVKSLKNDYKK